MLEILPTAAILSLFSIALAIIDCHTDRKKKTSSENPDFRGDRASDLVIFTPFVALFYTENFWLNLACTLPVILVSFMAQIFFYRKGFLNHPPELLTLAPGSYLLTVIGYFLFFHTGLQASSDGESTPQAAETSQPLYTWLSFWPYAVYIICFLFSITRKSSNGIFVSTLIIVLAVTILPFFTGHYWWAMLAGFCLLAVTMKRALDVLEPGSGGALSVVGGYFYSLAAFSSVLIYAILY